MNRNPYQSPSELADTSAPNRTPFVLAAVGAGLASAYWAALTLLFAFGAATGTTSPLQVVLPCVLIVLYAMRGLQIFKGSVAAAQRIILLHLIGAIAAGAQMSHVPGIFFALNAIKIAINLFGAATAYLAVRSTRR